MIDAEELGESAEVADPRHPFILEGGIIEHAYPLGIIPVSGDSQHRISVIFVAETDNKVLVAIPFSAWHRLRDRRLLPLNSLTKAALVQVPATTLHSREEPFEELTFRLWVGFLSPQVVQTVEWSTDEGEADIAFDMDGSLEYLPYATGLMEVCQDHFAFHTAMEEEEGAVPLPNGESGLADLTQRVNGMEAQLASLSQGMDQLLKHATSERPSMKASQPRVSFGGKPTVIGSGAASSTSTKFPRLNPSVVAAALQAGVGEKALAEMDQLVAGAGKMNKMREPALRKTRSQGPLSETEEELLPAEEFGLVPESNAPADPMTAAVTKLTAIVSTLAETKRSSSSNKVEVALDGVSGSTEPGGYGSGKRAAAARRALRAALVEHPADISAIIEKHMWEDLSSQTMTPGAPMPTMSARAWVEHRSKIGAYKATAYASWGVSGALDCLFKNDVAGARARLALLLLQIDQASVDRGGWALAAELSLEGPPPFHVLSQHNPPNVHDGDLPFSRLLDPRWAEISLAHLKETEDYVSKRKNLSKPKKEDDTTPDPKRKAKAKPRARGGEPPSQEG